ncbi:hypothetical protein FAM23868_002009 [Propionibacterium freudenreichii]|uniref:hypothetical protein n=1 Tax=Propionibacterium freudenreichii TaxID=1744 RepID=UPI00254C909C|nr:hypothetical protein [Propionibacterium freudenreichii]MDK9332669.1 hypothetical protein [Propionibacterium freudenreichii]
MTDSTDTTFTTRDEAIASIIDAIEAGGAVTDARAEYDLDAIADELVTLHSEETSEGATIASSVYFAIDADEDAFWAAVADHELIGITAEFTSINTPTVIDGRATTTDTITITRDGVELDAIDVESSEDEEAYDDAVRSVIGTDQPFTWVR